jgi:hypothetical protein
MQLGRDTQISSASSTNSGLIIAEVIRFESYLRQRCREVEAQLVPSMEEAREFGRGHPRRGSADERLGVYYFHVRLGLRDVVLVWVCALRGPQLRRKLMAIYKLLSSIVVNVADGTVLVAGQTVTDVGPGKQLPAGFIPNGCCDPQDADGIQKMWNAGPIVPTIDLFTPPPAIYWAAVPGSASPNRLYQLTGGGAALGPRPGFS